MAGDDGLRRLPRAAEPASGSASRSDEEAARLILCADVGIVPFKVEPFNDAGLPYRILKYARLGRRTVTPELAGVRTWERAVTRAATPDALRRGAARAGRARRAAPDARAARVGAGSRPRARRTRPLWERLEQLGIATR